MRFAVCTPLRNVPAMKSAGWDCIEANLRNTLQPTVPDSEWTGVQDVKAAGLPMLSGSSLMPAELKIVGAEADPAKVDDYMRIILRRAKAIGIHTIVFGSGGSRMVPEGFDRAAAREQILDFCRRSAASAASHGITIVIEPLNRGETNIINSVQEAMTYVKEVNHPNLQCLVDSYHMWIEKEPLENLRAAMPWIRHVHVADDETRVPPGVGGKSDYQAFFRVLKEGKYEGLIAVEAFGKTDVPAYDAGVLSFLKRQWAAA